jgi:hypothetical protein
MTASVLKSKAIVSYGEPFNGGFVRRQAFPSSPAKKTRQLPLCDALNKEHGCDDTMRRKAIAKPSALLRPQPWLCAPTAQRGPNKAAVRPRTRWFHSDPPLARALPRMWTFLPRSSGVGPKEAK